MRALFSLLLLSLTFLSAVIADDTADVQKTRVDYQVRIIRFFTLCALFQLKATHIE